MSWGKSFENVHITPSWNSYRKGRTEVPGPSLECRQTNLLKTWLESNKPDNQTHSRLRNDYLCERCQVLSQHGNELLQADEYASHIFDGSPEEDQKRFGSTECALCTMFRELSMYKEGQNYGVYVVNLLKPNLQRLAIDYGEQDFIMGLAVSEDNETRRLRRRLGRLPPPMKGLRWDEWIIPTQPSDGRHLNDPGTSPYYARTLDPVKADFESAKEWILECKASHPSCRATPCNLVGKIHVIDCVSRRVIPLSDGDEYLALSYVWGPPRPLEAGILRESTPFGTLPPDIPRTITDAISATLSLGYKYLWCDRYCINQSEPVSKAAQIAMMDSIYETAVVTLVAVAGQDDTHGLPGTAADDSGNNQLLPIARDPQPRARLGFSELVTVGPGIIETIHSSKWATRAWTFQEALLSTRCLIFGPRQLQFLCKTAYRHEALPRLPPLSRYNHEDNLSIGSVFGGGNVDPGEERTKLSRFVGLANELLQRDITYESDTLNAFRGILNRLKYHSFWGVPLITREGRELSQFSEQYVQPSGEGDDIPKRGHNVATLEDTKRIVATSKLDVTKKRHRPNLFHGGTYHHYMYDEFPGPGEPFEPSPTLAFLYGLTWVRYQEDDETEESPRTRRSQPTQNARRDGMPSWSWVSMSRGAYCYNTDPATGSTELPGDVLLNICNDIQVWIQDMETPLSSQIGWKPFDKAWDEHRGQTIPECGPLIKLDTLAGEAQRLIVSEPDWRGKKKMRLSLRAPPVEDEKSFEIFFDYESEIQPQLLEPGTHTGLGWKIVLICTVAYYNLDYPACWDSLDPCNTFLVLEPLNGVWKRIGTTSKSSWLSKDDEEDMMRLLKKESVVIC